MRTVLDVILPGKKVSVVYFEEETESSDEHRLRELLKWAEQAKKEKGSLLAEELLKANHVIVNSSESFNSRAAAIAYKKQRIAIWKALGYRIIVR